MPLSEQDARFAYFTLASTLNDLGLAWVERTARQLDRWLRRSTRLNNARFVQGGEDRPMAGDPGPTWRGRLSVLADATEQLVVAPFLMRAEIVRVARRAETQVETVQLGDGTPFTAGEVVPQAEAARELQALLAALQEQLV